VIRRDNEAEMIFRAQDIVRGLKRFQVEKGKLPTELKELMEPGNKQQYFLRRLWKDPLVKDGQWQYLYANPAGGLFDPTAAELPGATAPPGMPPPAEGLSPIGQQPTGLQGNQPGVPGSGKPGDSGVTGMPIAGVKSRCTEKTFRVFKNKTSYKDWTFSIFDLDPHAPAPPTPQQGAQFPPGGTPPPSGGTTRP
jgi:hypothetical protein